MKLNAALALLAVCVTAGCAHQAPAVSHYARAENWTNERALWLQTHCQLVRPVATKEPGVETTGPIPWESYWQLIDVDVAASTPEWAALAYACPNPPPWPREDGERVSELYALAHDGNDLTKCDADGNPSNYEPQFTFDLPEDTKPTISIVTPGTGAAPTADSYVRVRLHRMDAPTATGQDKQPVHAPIPFEYVPFERVAHLSCIPTWKDTLLKLRVGGRARMTPPTTGLFPVPSSEIELLDVGDESAFRESLGL
jgi:hypothetical protein